MTYDTRWKPRKIQIALTFDQLLEGIDELGRIATAHEIFGQHAGRVWQAIVSAGFDCIYGSTCIEILELRAGKWFAVCSVHGNGRLLSLKVRRQSKLSRRD